MQKKDIGYKTAPFLFNMLVSVSVTVLLKRAFYFKFDIEVPVQAAVCFIFSFIAMGAISFGLLIRLLMQPEEKGLP